ncbi:hypothetical protein M9458_028865, partial [Cirrhinus mrigala]
VGGDAHRSITRCSSCEDLRKLTHSPSRVSDTLRSHGRAARPVSSHPFGSREP